LIEVCRRTVSRWRGRVDTTNVADSSQLGIAQKLAALLTSRRITTWGTSLLVLSWFVYIHTMMVPGLLDRVGRFKGTDYVQFYVMGSLVLEGRADALYDGDAHLAEGRRVIDPGLPVYASHPNYSPHVALAFAPLALLPWEWSLALFLVLTTLCYGVGVWLIWRECPALRTHGSRVLVLAAASPLFFAQLRYGQTSAFALLFWSLAFVALCRNRPFLAGIVLGCLAYKPQMGIVVGVVFLAARQWQAVAGALSAVAAQLVVAWLATGWTTMDQYFRELGTLALNPSLVEIYPSEIHSLRGFFQLLIPSTPMVTACYLVTLVAVLAVAVRSWSGSGPLPVRVGQLVLLSVLASPHLISYDLLLLTLPLLLLADWGLRNRDHPLGGRVSLLLVLVYFSPFSGIVVARLTHVQISVIVFVLLAWLLRAICVNEPLRRALRTSASTLGARQAAMTRTNS
jgi:alpha-1,2-mannosyltransferase